MLDSIMLCLILVMNFSLVLILIRLNINHKDFFHRPEFEGLFTGAADKLAGLAEFLVRRKYIQLNDRFLTLTCDIFIISFLVSLPTMVATILSHS